MFIEVKLIKIVTLVYLQS